MWAVKNINCAPWPGMWLYQNNAAFVLYAVGIKWETERQILLREQVLAEPRGSMFSEVVSQPFQGCSSRFSCLWRFSGPLSEQIMCNFLEYHCSHILYLFILQLTDMSSYATMASGWSTSPGPYGYLFHTFVFPISKMGNVPCHKVLEPISTKVEAE